MKDDKEKVKNLSMADGRKESMKLIEEYIRREISGIKKEISKYGKLMAVQMVFALLLYLVLIANQLTNQYDGLWAGSSHVAQYGCFCRRTLWKHLYGHDGYRCDV